MSGDKQSSDDCPTSDHNRQIRGGIAMIIGSPVPSIMVIMTTMTTMMMPSVVMMAVEKEPK